jgi:hypothetical protein
MTEQAAHPLLERLFLSLYDGTHTELDGTKGASFETMDLFKTRADTGEERAFSPRVFTNPTHSQGTGLRGRSQRPKAADARG